MVRTQTLRPLHRLHLRSAGWDWLYADGVYLTPDVVCVSEVESEALYLAGAELYHLFVEAADRVVAEGRLAEMAIPARMHQLIEATWEDDRHWHLLGRFDLAGGLDGQPIKLLEFNADTPTLLPETSILQWALLKANGLDEARQFNQLYENLVENFVRFRQKNEDLCPPGDAKPGLLLTGFAGVPEDEANLQVLSAAAAEAGFEPYLEPLDRVTFSEGEGVFIRRKGAWIRCDFVYKLVPWEFILEREPDLFDLLEGLILDRLVVVANPPYALLLQSKRLLKVLWDLFPHSAYLLPADYTPLSGQRCVEKTAFGREGDNVTIYHADGTVLAETEGEYLYPAVYQAFVDLPHDEKVNLYQTCLFFVHEPCALSFRRGGLVIDNRSEFVGHLLEEGG